MPELPELEAIRRYLTKILENVQIIEVHTKHHTVIRFPTATEFQSIILESSFVNIERIGRILKFNLASTSKKLCLFIDHGLTGRLGWRSDFTNVPSKLVFSLHLENGRELIYHDNRLHGAIWLHQVTKEKRCQFPPVIANYGPDILSISKDAFLTRIKKFRAEIKHILTNQSFVTGIGNAYSDEILFAAQIHPFTKRTQMQDHEILRIYDSSQMILNNALEYICTTLEETNQLDNESKWRKSLLKIHLRGNEPCPVCNGRISAIKAKRLTNFCRKCQPSKNKMFI